MLASIDVGFSHVGIALWEDGKLHTVQRLEFPKTTNKKVRASSDRVDRAARWTKSLFDLLWRYDTDAVIGELPHGGSKSMNAAVEMNCATVLSGALCSLMEVPCEWCTPTDLKIAMCNKKGASKDEIIAAVCAWLGDIIKIEKNKKSTIYHVRTLKGVASFPHTKFDDVADALAVYKTMETSNMVRMFG